MAQVIHGIEPISFLALVAVVFVRSYCLYRLVKPFMASEVMPNGACPGRKPQNRNKGACYAAAAYFLTMLFFYVSSLNLDVYLICAIGGLTVFSVICWTDRRNYRQKLFLTVTFFSLNRFAAAMAEILYDNLYAFAGQTEYMGGHPHMWLALYALVCVFYLAVEFALTAIGIWLVIKVYANKQAEMEIKELIMLALPSLMGMVGFEIVRYYRVFYIIQTQKVDNVYEMLSLLFYVVSIITIVVVIVLYQDIKAKQEENLQSGLLEAQVAGIKRHLGQVESLYRDIRGAKHDMANHILTLERLYASNKAKEAQAYSEELKAGLVEMAGEIKSGNPVTDVILQEMKKEAEKKGISFFSEFYFPADCGINAFDVSVILNNALQNAIENTLANGRISVVSYRRKNAYMIEASNTFAGNLRWDSQSGLPLTGKKKKDGHGYGLLNIRKVAGKYAGDIDIVQKNGEFRLCVMLMAGEP